MGLGYNDGSDFVLGRGDIVCTVLLTVGDRTDGTVINIFKFESVTVVSL